MRYKVINNDRTDKVNYGKVVQRISQKRLDKWRIDSAKGQDVPIGMYIIEPIPPKPKKERESESSKHCDSGYMNDVRFGDGE